MSSQHMRSSQQESTVTFHLEAAKKIFSRGAESQIGDILYFYIELFKVSREELEAIYSPLFKELAMAIIGRDDIPVAPAKEYSLVFRYLCDPLCVTLLGEDTVELLLRCVIRYILIRDPKHSPSGNDVQDLNMDGVLHMLLSRGPTNRDSDGDIIIPIVLRNFDTCRHDLHRPIQAIGQRESVSMCHICCKWVHSGTVSYRLQELTAHGPSQDQAQRDEQRIYLC